jgi:hypothetical protein
MTDEHQKIFDLEYPLPLRVDVVEYEKLPKFHRARKLSINQLYAGTRMRQNNLTGKRQYKLLECDEFFNENLFLLVENTSIN